MDLVIAPGASGAHSKFRSDSATALPADEQICARSVALTVPLTGEGPLFQPESGVAVVGRGEDADGHEAFPLSRPVHPFLDGLHRGETAREARVGNLAGPSVDETNSGEAARKGEARLVFAHGARHPPDRQRQLPEFSWTLRSQTLIRRPALPPPYGICFSAAGGGTGVTASRGLGLGRWSACQTCVERVLSHRPGRPRSK